MKLNGEEKFKFSSEQEKRMGKENSILTGSKGETAQPHPVKITIRMQQGERTGQPIYSNFTSVHGEQGVIIVDFGFLDPETMHALNRMVRSGEKVSGTIDAKMSCRMAISIEAAKQLVQQLNQLLGKGTHAQVQMNQPNTVSQTTEVAPSIGNSDEKSSPDSNQSGFRFPWSKKTH